VRFAIPWICVLPIACTSSSNIPDAGSLEEDGGFTVFDAGPKDGGSHDSGVDAGPPPIADWYRDSVGYQLFVRSFQDSDGDGIGDLRGLLDRLDELEDLGVDLLWIMPIAAGPSWHGYEVNDHRAIDPAYGTIEDLDAVLADAHARGMRVILDHVINHTSIDHPWFADPQRSDWFVWRETNPGWSQPWSSYPAWHERGGRWYYGVFSSRMPDLDYTNPDVRAEMIEISRFWLERGLDGFRLDGARYLIETGPGAQQQDTAETRAFWRELRVAIEETHPASMLVGEVWAETEIVSRYFGTSDAPELHMAFDFDSSYGIADSIRAGNAARAKATLSERLRQLPAWGESGTFLANHDQVRIASTLEGLDPEALRLAGAMLLTWPGTPWIYYGEEIGMTNGNGGYDTRRPMQWAGGLGAGFTSGTPWAPPASTAAERSVEGQAGDPESLYSLYRDFIRVRREHPALLRGATQILIASGSSSEPLVLARTFEGESLIVAYNFSTSNNEVVIGAAGIPRSTRFVDVRSGEELARASTIDDLRLTLGPRGTRILRAE
jgi:glycosidase